MSSSKKVNGIGSTSSSSGSPKGMSKFYTKIRTKIEDKIPSKNKTPSTKIMKVEMPAFAAVSTDPNGGNTYVDSDEECRLALTDSNISLEDEIFEELEKASHDENRWNAVLKSFDKLAEDCVPISLPVVKVEEPKKEVRPKPPPLLQKSKTCSIIESKCILKKSSSNPGDNLMEAKSLWSLHDFENFAKAGKKSDTFDRSKLPVLKKTSVSTLSISGRSKIPVASPKIIPKAVKSVQKTPVVPPRKKEVKKEVPVKKEKTPVTKMSQVKKKAAVSPPSPTKQYTQRPRMTRAVSIQLHPKPQQQIKREQSDILLSKCIEKGHQILRKVESIPNYSKKTTLTKASSLSKMNYADERKVAQPKLEACKIIPPVLGETSQETEKLLINVKEDKKNGYQSDHDSDDSGHISNENEDLSPPLDGDGSPKFNKISDLLVKFESHKKPETVTTVKVAEVRPMQSCIQSSVEIFPTYRKEVLFRSGVLNQLEAKRDELLSDRIIQMQAYCRGYLARRRMAQRRVQELAVRCIQRNVKAFMAVRDWPWWRLLVRVTPLLNVHRTEEQLKSATDEVQVLRAKLEKIENDRNLLKTENEKLESKLSEMTVDLTEERSTGNITSERLDAETAERLKLEKELHDQQNKVKNLQETTEKLEMELICAKSDLNGISEDEDPENDDLGGVYKLKYERAARELEFTKRRLQSQHEHDLEQLVGLKKQLEKKLSDAYEEVEEQRQVVGQWKRKTQKMTNEMNDLRMLLEEQNGRNNLLEKKQRKFDAECQCLQDAARQERQAKDRLAREKDVLIAEKFTLEQSLADTRLELDLKEEKLSSLQIELEEMAFGGGTEEEVANLKRSKMDLDRRVKEQEEELDEMAGQVQLLEQAKLRLEMTLETMRKEARREAQQRDDELEEARGSAYKKIKALECQLETEHEERTLLLREKHELERRLHNSEDQDRADRQAEEAINQKLKRDLRKYKALLKDAQAQLDRHKADSPGKTLLRQLRNQLEDAEAARTIAVKARQTAESELTEVQTMLDESQRARHDAEEKATISTRDKSELQAQIEENEEELAELMKKYSATVKQLNNEQMASSEYEFRIADIEAERNTLKEQLAELQTRLENVENMSDPSAAVHSKRLELRAKELESRLDLEQATRTRLETQVNRLKEHLDKVQAEVSQSKLKELTAQEQLKKSQKNLKEVREELHTITNKEQESISKRKEMEKKIEMTEQETSSVKNDLRLALQRIADLQQAMEGGDDDLSESDDSESSDGSFSDLEERLKPIHVKRTSIRETNGVAETTVLLKEKQNDSSPRITLTSPGVAPASSSLTNGNGDSLNGKSSSFA